MLIGFSPENDNTKKIMEKAVMLMCIEVAALVDSYTAISFRSANDQLKNAVKTKGFQTDGQLVDHYKVQEGKMTHAVVFTDMQDRSAQFFIRPCIDSKAGCKSVKPSTEHVYPNPLVKASFNDDYNYNGLLLLQWAVSKSIMTVWSGNEPVSTNLTFESMASEGGRIQDVLYAVAGLSMYIIFSTLLANFCVVSGIMYEKETGLLEFCKMSGLTLAANWVSWFIYGLIVVSITMLFFYVLLILPVGGDAILSKTSETLLLFFFITVGAVLVSFQLTCSALFSKGRGAVIAAVLIPLILITLNTVYLNNAKALSTKFLYSFSFFYAFDYGFKIITQYEIQGDGIGWSTFNTAPLMENFTLFYAWLMLIVNIIIFSIITWYLSNVFPGEHGAPQPYYFFLTPERGKEREKNEKKKL